MKAFSQPNFLHSYPSLSIESLAKRSLDTEVEDVVKLIDRGTVDSLGAFAVLISPKATVHLESLAQRSQQLTQQYFGKTIRLFAPLYLSNECINICTYCGFSRNNSIPRTTIPVDDVVEQTQKLALQGFRSVLLVAGEHPRYVSNGYIQSCIERSLPHIPSLSLEIGPLETDDYRPLVKAGSEGLVVYQETYHLPTYREVHTGGPKKDYHWRIEAPERAYAGGFRRLGIGVLFGLYDWRYEALALAAHACYLRQHCWKAFLSLSLLRLRPASGGFQPDPRYAMSDREFTQLICALRLFLPHVGIVLSTRESSRLRDGLISLGVTTMSAGSSTEPGGYAQFDELNWAPPESQAGEQFHIADERSPQIIADVIRNKGYEPVWKDFDQSLVVSSGALQSLPSSPSTLPSSSAPAESQPPPNLENALSPQNSITVEANGRRFILTPAKQHLSDFIQSQGLAPEHVVVERNRTALSPEEARSTVLHDGDCLEIVRIVAGG